MDAQNEVLLIKGECQNQIIEITDFSETDHTEPDYNPQKSVCLTFYHTVEKRNIFESFVERIRGAFSYFFFGKAGCVEVILKEKDIELICEKMKSILNSK